MVHIRGIRQEHNDTKIRRQIALQDMF